MLNWLFSTWNKDNFDGHTYTQQYALIKSIHQSSLLRMRRKYKMQSFDMEKKIQFAIKSDYLSNRMWKMKWTKKNTKTPTVVNCGFCAHVSYCAYILLQLIYILKLISDLCIRLPWLLVGGKGKKHRKNCRKQSMPCTVAKYKCARWCYYHSYWLIDWQCLPVLEPNQELLYV